LSTLSLLARKPMRSPASIRADRVGRICGRLLAVALTRVVRPPLSSETGAMTPVVETVARNSGRIDRPDMGERTQIPGCDFDKTRLIERQFRPEQAVSCGCQDDLAGFP
jgi:hypothetical protein